MAYKTFTTSQRATVKALLDQMRANADLWVDVRLDQSLAWETKAEMLHDCANDWDTEGCFTPVADFIQSLRESVRHSRRSQAEVFAAIRALGFTVRKTDCGEYRVANPIKFHASRWDREQNENSAAYCSDLAEALAHAVWWSNEKKEARDRRQREQLLRGWESRAGEIFAQKRLAYGDRFATADEAAMQQEDPLAWLELIAEYSEAEIGIDKRGHWADEDSVERSKAEVIAEDLAAKAQANSCPAEAPNPAQPSAEQVAQLVKAAKAARFALESAIYLQGLKALAPAAVDLIDALEPFEIDIEVIAEAQMRAAVLCGRPDLAA
jgi:hypothetical protein